MQLSMREWSNKKRAKHLLHTAILRTDPSSLSSDTAEDQAAMEALYEDYQLKFGPMPTTIHEAEEQAIFTALQTTSPCSPSCRPECTQVSRAAPSRRHTESHPKISSLLRPSHPMLPLPGVDLHQY